MDRVAWLLSSQPLGVTDRTDTINVDPFIEQVALAMRRRLGTSGHALPRGEPILHARDMAYAYFDVAIVFPLRGMPVVRPIGRTARFPENAAEMLLLRAARSVLSDSGTRAALQKRLRRPSAAFRFIFRRDVARHDTTVASPGNVSAGRRPAGYPVFTIGMPRDVPPRSVRALVADSPSGEGNRERDAEFNRLRFAMPMEFVVDTAGRAVPESVHEYWPANSPTIPETARRAYQQFAESAKRTVLSARFEPARSGGCPVRKMVRMSVEFR